MFDTVRWDSGGWFDQLEPTRLSFPVDAICRVEVAITVLGTAYDGPPADDILLSVRRDGDPTAFVAAIRLSDEQPEPAQLLSTSMTDWFEAGEYIEAFVSPPGLIVEANWPGRSNISPVLTAVCDMPPPS